MQGCRKLKKIKQRIDKTEVLEKNYAKEMLSKVKELKEIEIKLEKLEIKILRKSYRNETTGLKILTEEKMELDTKKRKTEDKIREHRIGIDTIISNAEDLKTRVINKLNEMKKIRTKMDELEKEKALMCIGY